jgi:hypothetical protein
MQVKTTSNRGRGWLAIAIVAGLVGLSGIYPLVAEPENRVMAAAVIGLAAFALGVSAGPLRQGEPSTWKVMWIFPSALVFIAIFMSTDDATFGIIYFVFAAVAGLGLFWSRPVVPARTAETVT